MTRSAVFHWERATPIPAKVAHALLRAAKPIEEARLALIRVQREQGRELPRYVAGHWEAKA